MDVPFSSAPFFAEYNLGVWPAQWLLSATGVAGFFVVSGALFLRWA